MLPTSIDGDTLRFGPWLAVSLQRTLRLPDDGRTYPLPPGLGAFPVLRVQDFEERVPSTWLKHRGVFIPLFQREALWLGFQAPPWRPHAVKVGVGGINAVSGEPWDEELHAGPQDYIVCPLQPWLDGINAGDGSVRQFVAAPLGEGLTVEAQLAGAEETGGVQLLVFAPRPGRFPDEPPARTEPGRRARAGRGHALDGGPAYGAVGPRDGHRGRGQNGTTDLLGPLRPEYLGYAATGGSLHPSPQQ